MDPLSVTAGIIAVLQASHAVISICLECRAAVKKAPTALVRVVNETKDLRNVLEALESVASELCEQDQHDGCASSALQTLATNDGPLERSLAALKQLEALILSTSGLGRDGSRLKVVTQTIAWHLKLDDVQEHLNTIERCKSTLSLALTTNVSSALSAVKKITSSTQDAVQSVDDNLSRLIVGLAWKELDTKHRLALQWLSPTDPFELHERALAAHQADTSMWFIGSSEFGNWLDADRSFLWLSGSPGAGKTTLFSAAVQRIISTDDTVLAKRPTFVVFYYCSFNDSKTQKPCNIIGSLLAQIMVRDGRSFGPLLEAYEARMNQASNKRPPTISELKSILPSIADDADIVLMIDALDECLDRAELLSYLRFVRKDVPNVKIFATSRSEPDISKALSDWHRVRLEDRAEDMNDDIRSYIYTRMHQAERLQWLKPSLQHEIAESLAGKSAGMFRYAQCQLDAICRLRSIKAIRVALKDLPIGLDETYERILIQVEPHDVSLVRNVLMWLAFPVMPMTLQELHEAIAVAFDATDLDQESLLSSPDDILELCGSLLSVSEHRFVRLAHLSVKDYLLSDKALDDFRLQEAGTRQTICALCLTYLTFDHLQDGPSRSEEAYRQRLHGYPLLIHAAVIWPYHFRVVGSTDTALSTFVFDKFFHPQNRHVFMSWVQILNANRDAENWDFYAENATPLYYAASFGMTDAVRRLIKDGADLNVGASRFGGTAVHAATLRLHIPAMIELLEAGADPNKSDLNGITPMDTACAYGDAEVIKTLLKYGVKPEAAMDVVVTDSRPTWPDLRESSYLPHTGEDFARTWTKDTQGRTGGFLQTTSRGTRKVLQTKTDPIWLRTKDKQGAPTDRERIFVTTEHSPRNPRLSGRVSQTQANSLQLQSHTLELSAVVQRDHAASSIDAET